MGEFDGQVAVVTGGARGIGAEIARRLARGGVRVVCADVLDTTDIVAEINDAGGAAEGRELNVTDAQAAAEGIKAVHEAHGRLDILVNNAGVTRDKLLVRMKPEDWDLVLDINLDGVFKVTQPVAKLMMRQRSGRIVNVASVVGLMGNAGQTNYAASKAGLIGFTKSLARELGPRNVTVNAVAPGYSDDRQAHRRTARDAVVDRGHTPSGDPRGRRRGGGLPRRAWRRIYHRSCAEHLGRALHLSSQFSVLNSQ